MKVVCCKKCGAKYQLDDNDDISTYECTSCTGDLELCEGYGSNNDNNLQQSTNPNITYCVNCGLRYSLKPSDNILDYECESCGGSLRYVDEYLNKDIDKIVAEHEKQKIMANIESRKTSNQPQKQKTSQNATNSKKSLTQRFGNFFSEKRIHEIADEEAREREAKKNGGKVKTAKTKIPKATRRKFEKEFLVPRTNDYNVLKGFLINEFYKGVLKYYGVKEPEELPNGSFRQFTANDDLNKLKDKSKIEFKDSIKAETETINNPKNIAIIIGVIIFVASTIEIIFINMGIGIVTIFIGVILICYGLYRKSDTTKAEVKKRTKIIRDYLLTLPPEYYVFYDVKVPGSKKGINHLVIGPSGIYEIISKKYNPSSKINTESPAIIERKEEKIEEIINQNNKRRFKYTTKENKFPKDNKIKQETLKLGENLINFLSDNGIPNCFVEPLVGFVNDNVVVINMPLTDEDLFIDELIHKIKYGSVKLDSETIDKCAVLLSKFAADCSNES